METTFHACTCSVGCYREGTTVFLQWYAHILFVAHPPLKAISHYTIQCNSVGIYFQLLLVQLPIFLSSNINKHWGYHCENTVCETTSYHELSCRWNCSLSPVRMRVPWKSLWLTRGRNRQLLVSNLSGTAAYRYRSKESSMGNAPVGSTSSANTLLSISNNFTWLITPDNAYITERNTMLGWWWWWWQ